MGKGSTTTVQKADPWAPSQPYLIDAMGQAENLFNSGGMSASPYSGQRVAGFTQPMLDSQQMIMDRATGPQLTNAASGTLSSMMDPSQYGARLDAVKENALGSAIPSAVSMFSGNGMTDSTTAMDTVGRAATQAVAPIEYQAYENAQNRAMQAAGMAPSIDQAGYLPAQMMAGVGAQQQAMNQAMLDSDMAQHYESGNKAANDLSAYTQMLLGYGGQGGNSTSTQSSNPGTMGTLGGLMQGAGMLAMLFSDRRLKRAIRRIGETLMGTPLYAFKYLWGDKSHVGVMADEVPKAIAGEIHGFSVIDFGRVA